MNASQRMLLEQPAAEGHAVPDEVTRQAERGPTAETDPVEQQHRGRPKFGSSPAAVGEREILALHRVRSRAPALPQDR